MPSPKPLTTEQQHAVLETGQAVLDAWGDRPKSKFYWDLENEVSLLARLLEEEDLLAAQTKETV